jgi:hypothetical protein
MLYKTVIASGLAALAFASAPALAANQLTSNIVGGAAGAPTTVFNFNVAGVNSWDVDGDPSNEVFTINIGAGSQVVGIGWDVTINAIAPSWLNEAAVLFGSTSAPFLFPLTPGSEENSGTSTYSSGGIVNLISSGRSFTVDADGLLRLEFFEWLDDDPDVIDATWLSGNLTIEVAAVPEPATYGMLALGLLALSVAARRRKA